MSEEAEGLRQRVTLRKLRESLDRLPDEGLSYCIDNILTRWRVWAETTEPTLDICTEILIDRGYGMAPWEPKEEA